MGERAKRPGPAPKPAKDGDKLQARHRVNMEVRCGAIRRPNDLPCTDCGHVWHEGDKRHEYDHYLGYDAGHHLDVQPVCSKCHSARDSAKANATHCIRGHEFTSENTYIKPNGCRSCRGCRRAHDKTRRDAAWWRAYRAKRAA